MAYSVKWGDSSQPATVAGVSAVHLLGPHEPPAGRAHERDVGLAAQEGVDEAVGEDGTAGPGDAHDDGASLVRHHTTTTAMKVKTSTARLMAALTCEKTKRSLDMSLGLRAMCSYTSSTATMPHPTK